MRRTGLIIWLIVLAGGIGLWRFHVKLRRQHTGASAVTRIMEPVEGTLSGALDYVMAISADGALYGWGQNDRQQLGLSNVWNQSVPAKLPADRTWRRVHAGGSASYAITANGELWRHAIGAETYNGHTGQRMLPDPKGYESLHWDSRWLKVEEDWRLAVGLDVNGELWFWNDGDILPEAARDVGGKAEVELTHATPEQKWVDFCHAGHWVYAISDDGTLWGSATQPTNSFAAAKPSQASELVVIRSKAGLRRVRCAHDADHVLALDAQGELWGFGSNKGGELGDGDGNPFTPNRPTPAAQMKRLTNMRWSQVAVGPGFTLGIAADGSLWSWGNNFHGVLGTGDQTSSDKPVQIDREHTWVEVVAGERFSLGLRSDGSLYAWGDNSGAVLGDGGASSMRTTPTRVYGDIQWGETETGVAHADQ